MSDYLVKQAIDNVWCTPEQDQQSRIRLAKLTRYGGVYTKVDVMWRSYPLPVIGQLFHVYQIGGIAPAHLGLTTPARAGIWIKFTDACIKEETIVDLYSVNGIQSPRTLAWYTFSDEGDLVVAVQRFDKVPIDYNTEELYLRVYHNAYYGTQRRDVTVDYIDVQGGIMLSTEQILALQQKYNQAAAKGATYAFVNGILVDKIDLFTVQLGDVAEFVYDGSIYAIEDLRIGDLGVFDSTLDQKRKYLLHMTKALKTTITYHDDVDVFVLKKEDNGRFRGLFYHRNQLNANGEPDALRQLTHADYAIAIPYLTSFISTQAAWQDLNINDLTIRVQMRKSGWRRPLVNEANRIKELYKLPDEEIVKAMIGIDAVVPEWQAAHLEASNYPKVMGSAVTKITPQIAQDMFGYNAMAGYLAPTPQFTKNISGQALVDIPLNLQYRSTVYEYDFDGKLLGYYQHALGAIWRAKNTDTRLVQIITGYAVTALDEKYGQQAASLDENLDYRMYTCGMFGGLPDNQWKDVTDSALYTKSKNGITWLTSPHTTYTMVRSNRDFLGYDLRLPVQGGVLKFTLTSEQDRGIGLQNSLMQIQMGELDVWLNQWALVEGIDYIVNFPEVVIINKKFIDPRAEKQLITVRFCGHCNSDLSRAVLGDRGFVSHGVLSNNDRFDLRDDKVQHVAIGGAIYDKSELQFAENHSGVNVPGVNGVPYVVRDIVVPLRGTTNAKTYEARNAALIVDKHVSDYLTLKMAKPTFTEADGITELYPVYSPFVSALIDDLKTKVFNDERIYGDYNFDTVKAMCAFYEPLLQFEPTRAPNLADLRFTSVQAYYKNEVTELDVFQYRFLQRAVTLYLNNAISLSHFVMATA